MLADRAGSEVFGLSPHALDDLYSRCGVQLTQRRLWQQTWLDVHPEADVWTASVTQNGRLEGVLVLHETVGPDGQRAVRACAHEATTGLCRPWRARRPAVNWPGWWRQR